ncbi:lytic murein transglycosylase [Mesorhizobium sp. B3-2-1]|nr:lytic murein transglycosylase [Mesorhizobium sp. B3-2-1]
MSSLSAPLCPAGHLPHMGGDWQLRRSTQSCNANDWRKPRWPLISPLVGEIPGRAEGGAS